MELLGTGLMYIGLIGLFVTGIWLLILEFQSSIIWGIGCLIIPLLSLLWVILNWDEGKTPFLYSIAAGVIYGVGIVLKG